MSVAPPLAWAMRAFSAACAMESIGRSPPTARCACVLLDTAACCTGAGLAALGGDLAVLALATGTLPAAAAAVEVIVEAVAPVPAARACAAIGAGAATELAGACATACEPVDGPLPHAVRTSAVLTTISSAVTAPRLHTLFINEFLAFGSGFPEAPWCDRGIPPAYGRFSRVCSWPVDFLQLWRRISALGWVPGAVEHGAQSQCGQNLRAPFPGVTGQLLLGLRHP